MNHSGASHPVRAVRSTSTKDGSVMAARQSFVSEASSATPGAAGELAVSRARMGGGRCGQGHWSLRSKRGVDQLSRNKHGAGDYDIRFAREEWNGQDYRSRQSLSVSSHGDSLTILPILSWCSQIQSGGFRNGRLAPTNPLDSHPGDCPARLRPEEAPGTGTRTREWNSRVQGCAERDQRRLRQRGTPGASTGARDINIPKHAR